MNNQQLFQRAQSIHKTLGSPFQNGELSNITQKDIDEEMLKIYSLQLELDSYMDVIRKLNKEG